MKNKKALDLIENRYLEIGARLDKVPNIESKQALEITHDILILNRLARFFKKTMSLTEEKEILASGELMSQAKRNHPIFSHMGPDYYTETVKIHGIKEQMIKAFDAEHGNTRS